MTLLAHLRSPRLDRDAAFEAAVREGTPPSRERCPYCGQDIPPAASPASSAPAEHSLSVDEELAALGNGRAAR